MAKEKLSKEEKEDLKRIQSLRDYYRENFRNGYSHQSFLLWQETFIEKGLLKIKKL